MADVRLRYATVRTADVARSAAFYEGLLGLARTRTEAEFVQLDAGGAELCLDLAQGDEQQPSLIFDAGDLEGLAERFVAAGVEIVQRAETFMIVRDPDGNLVVFEL